MDSFRLDWIHLLVFAIFVSETWLFVDAYYFNSRCIGMKCISYIGDKQTYAQAEEECSTRWNGKIGYFTNSPGTERREQWIYNQMDLDKEKEIWMGAKLVNLKSDGRSPKCKIISGPDSAYGNVQISKKNCREKRGVLCMIDISEGCPDAFTECEQKCFKYFNGRYTWQEAREHCKAQGDGVEMFDPGKVQVKKYYQCYSNPRSGKDAWIRGAEEEIQWSTGDKFDPQEECTSWMEGEPSSQTNKNCISYNVDQGWKMKDCSASLPFACFYLGNMHGNNPLAPDSPMDEMTTAGNDILVVPDRGTTEEDNKMGVMLGMIALSVVIIAAIAVIIIVLVCKRRHKGPGSQENLTKASSQGSLISTASSPRYLVQPSAPTADEKKKISTVSRDTNLYESIDETKVQVPSYQDLKSGHNEYAHPYTGLDFTAAEQNHRNERSVPDSPPAYDEPYADKRRFLPDRSPKIPRPMVATPRVRPPPVPSKPHNKPPSESGVSQLPAGQCNKASGNQGEHSYLELLPDATPEELESVNAASAKSSDRSRKPPRGKKPESSKKTEGEGKTVKDKAKALEGKFKLSTSPTLGRMKAADSKYTSVANGDVFQK